MQNLTRKQIEFIQSKVIRLGSVEAVKRDYNRDDAVSEFARVFAQAWFKPIKADITF